MITLSHLFIDNERGPRVDFDVGEEDLCQVGEVPWISLVVVLDPHEVSLGRLLPDREEVMVACKHDHCFNSIGCRRVVFLDIGGRVEQLFNIYHY